MPDESPTPAARPAPRRAWVALALLALVALSSGLRVRAALRDPEIARSEVTGLLKSDPGLLYYITERVLAGGGLPPADFRADPRVAWPARTDLPAEFTVGQEFLVAWCQLASGGALPLHETAIVVMALTASLALVGAYLAARALTGSRWLGLFSAAFMAALPTSYRTVGFVLVREDLSFPLLALHLGLLMAALRRPRAGRFLAAGLALAAALATWHALAFFVALEAAAFALALLTTGRNLFEPRGAGWMALPVALACLAVPALRAGAALLSPAVVLGAALYAAARVGRPPRARGVAALAVLALGLGLRALLPEWVSGHAHVYEVLRAKLAHLGALPRDPEALSFDARLLWQGPFETLRASWALRDLGLGALGVPAALWMLRERALAPRALALFALLSLPAAWLVARVLILPGLLLPVALAWALARRPRAWLAPALVGAQALLLASYLGGYSNPWYRPVGRQDELTALVAALPALVPEGEAVAADFMTSTAVLAHTGRPVLYTPKYETEASRRRIEAFYRAFFHGTPEELRELLVGTLRCRYLVVDRFTLGVLSRYTAGFGPGEAPAPGTCAALLLSQDESVLRGVPGYELLYRSPPTIRQRDGSPYDLFRVYRLDLP